MERRLAFIEERLFWLGEVNRTDLVSRFGVSMSQASVDIARYLALEPAGVDYDKSAKRYVAHERFKPVLAKPDASRFLGELRLVNVGILSVDETMFGAAMPFDATPLPDRPIDPFVLRAVLRAARGKRALDAAYQSMSRTEPMQRTIEPHALGYDGFRWHARAFDRERGEFRDFVLGRLTRPKIGDEARSSPADDFDWQNFVDLVIAPHPKLTPAQSQAIASDYGIRNGSATIPVRRALLFYALKRLGLDVSPDVRPPNEQHIVLVNRREIESQLRSRGET
ncbi:MAG TPA: WYL domain-containing protein [Xanthobacteraceae bacterium]|nr:WYL domain-containing protein [Xanthobacteraceae bacterium]